MLRTQFHRAAAGEPNRRIAGLYRISPTGFRQPFGFSNERIWLFLATGLSLGAQKLEADEIIEVVELPLERALDMVAAGEICDGKTILGLVAAQAKMRR